MTPGVWALFYVGLAISLSPIYFITWRVARTFGWRGLAVCLIVVGVIGPPRDYLYAAVYPEWMVFAQGVAPVLADAAAYLGLVALGHAVDAVRQRPLAWKPSGATAVGRLRIEWSRRAPRLVPSCRRGARLNWNVGRTDNAADPGSLNDTLEENAHAHPGYFA